MQQETGAGGRPLSISADDDLQQQLGVSRQLLPVEYTPVEYTPADDLVSLVKFMFATLRFKGI